MFSTILICNTVYSDVCSTCSVIYFTVSLKHIHMLCDTEREEAGS